MPVKEKFAHTDSEWAILLLRFLGLFLPSGLASSSSRISSKTIKDAACVQYDATSNALSMRSYDAIAEEDRREMKFRNESLRKISLATIKHDFQQCFFHDKFSGFLLTNPLEID